jgi:hypothetical protein
MSYGAQLEREAEAYKDRLRKLLELVSEETRPCKACGTELFFVRHRNGMRAPYTADGVNHFINCPSAEEFRKQKAAAK